MTNYLTAHRSAPSRLPGVMIGVGMGGFIDGIVLHQVLQWHNMGSAVIPPVTMAAMQANMRWDGLFHAAVWIVAMIGIVRLLGDARRNTALPLAGAFAGQFLFGWGSFNLVEGLIDHHLLGLHHVRDLPMHMPVYDVAFLAVGGVGFVVAGWLLMRKRSQYRIAGAHHSETNVWGAVAEE
jgi:uncharacterized membrane protein